MSYHTFEMSKLAPKTLETSKANTPTSPTSVSRRVLRQKISRATEGLLNNLTDLVLAQILFGLGAMSAGYNSRKVYEASFAAQEVFAFTPYTSFKNALLQLKRKGLIKSLTSGFHEGLITQKGKQRLTRLFPVYERQRPWDKRLYLITYDIPENERGSRDLLRRKLKELGCAGLQQSVFLTPYNPRQIIKELIQEYRLKGRIVISDTGSDGVIGDRNLPETLWEVYALEEINENYRIFVETYQRIPKSKINLTKLALDYFSILKTDPQLPFELLPPQWLGDEAYEIFERYTRQITRFKD